MNKVILETPYAGNVEENVKYAIECMRDCLNRGEAPFASHLLYTQCLDDTIPEQRNIGMQAGFAWSDCCERAVIYVDLGVSEGMWAGIDQHIKNNKRIEFRRIYGLPNAQRSTSQGNTDTITDMVAGR